MSLHLEPIGDIPTETARAARAAFPKGSVALRLRDAFTALYQDEDFQKLYPTRGQPGLAPWRLWLVMVFQFLEHLSDRQAADAVRGRIDWKFALGLELTDPGFHLSVLGAFRARLVAGQAEHLLLDTMLERFNERGWSSHAASSAPTAHTCWQLCTTCICWSWWLRHCARRLMILPLSRPTGCARSRGRFGSSDMDIVSRTTACPRARRSA